MSARRVVITGMGWVTPLGHDVDAAWSRLLAGETGIGPVTRFDATTFATNFAAEVKDFDLGAFGIDPGAHEGAGTSTCFALGAAARAWQQAGLDKAPPKRPSRVGMYLGAGEGTP